MSESIRQAVRDILGVCQPQEIILFAEKRTMSTGKLKSFSLCVVAPEGTDCRRLRTRLHLALSADVPVNLSVYTPMSGTISPRTIPRTRHGSTGKVR